MVQKRKQKDSATKLHEIQKTSLDVISSQNEPKSVYKSVDIILAQIGIVKLVKKTNLS